MAGSGYHEQLQWHLAPAMVAAVGNEVLPLEEEGGVAGGARACELRAVCGGGGDKQASVSSQVPAVPCRWHQPAVCMFVC